MNKRFTGALAWGALLVLVAVPGSEVLLTDKSGQPSGPALPGAGVTTDDVGQASQKTILDWRLKRSSSAFDVPSAPATTADEDVTAESDAPETEIAEPIAVAEERRPYEPIPLPFRTLGNLDLETGAPRVAAVEAQPALPKANVAEVPRQVRRVGALPEIDPVVPDAQTIPSVAEAEPLPLETEVDRPLEVAALQEAVEAAPVVVETPPYPMPRLQRPATPVQVASVPAWSVAQEPVPYVTDDNAIFFKDWQERRTDPTPPRGVGQDFASDETYGGRPGRRPLSQPFLSGQGQRVGGIGVLPAQRGRAVRLDLLQGQ